MTERKKCTMRQSQLWGFPRRAEIRTLKRHLQPHVPCSSAHNGEATKPAKSLGTMNG